MNLLKSELRKFFTTKTWLWLLLGTIAMALVQVIFILSFAGSGDPETGVPTLPPLDSPEIQTLVLSAPAQATIFIAILGIIGVTSEYRHGTITPTFLTTPARWKVTVAKLVAYLLLGLLFAAIAALVVIGVVAIWVGSAGGSLDLSGNNGKTLAGAAIASGLYGIIGVGVGLLIRNQIAAITGLLAYMFVVESILASISNTQAVFKYLPGGAARALYTYQDVPGQETDLLSPVAGGLLLAGWAALLAIIAYVISTRREVS